MYFFQTKDVSLDRSHWSLVGGPFEKMSICLIALLFLFRFLFLSVIP